MHRPGCPEYDAEIRELARYSREWYEREKRREARLTAAAAAGPETFPAPTISTYRVGDQAAADVERLEEKRTAIRDAFGMDPSSFSADLVERVGTLAVEALELRRRAEDEVARASEVTAARARYAASPDGVPALTIADYRGRLAR